MSKKKRIIIPVLLVLVAASIWFGIIRDGGGNGSWRASGTVEATEARLGFPVPGRVDMILVREGDLVQGGTELAVLDRAETTARYQQAVAQVSGARAMLSELESGARVEEIARARAARDAAAEQSNDAGRDLDRVKELYAGGAVSKEALDKQQTAVDVARSRFTEAAEFLRQLESGPRAEKIAAQRAVLQQAQAHVAAIEAALANMTIRAPFTGLITVRHHQPGEIVPAGATVLTMQNRDDRWVRTYVPENKIGALQLGAPATISTDSYKDKTYAGEVIFIAAEAEFTPKTVQTAEERVRLVYQVKVRITDDPSYELKAGMPADVELELAGG
ncbi:HlyD family secretion protein [Candidatus Zixiibacteriota bacterium]